NKEFIDMLDENFNIKEGLGFDKFGYSFYKENGNETPIQMLGTGKKLFAILDKLIQNHSISKDTLVMFDEPEEGMHPEWQLEFIDKLFTINLPFVLTTHSPFIIQSLVYHTKKVGIEAKYYTVEHSKELGCAISMSELKPLNIVKDLTNPMLTVRGF
ncbi:MAG: AAA family ATPase, partial [Clostridium sp.]